MSNLTIIKDELLEATKVLQAFICDDTNLENIEQAATLLAASFKNEGKTVIYTSHYMPEIEKI